MLKNSISIASQWAVGIVLAFLLFFVSTTGYYFYRDSIPVTSYFSASVSIPDFKTGENPPILYTVNVKERFIGTVHSTILDAKNQTTICIVDRAEKVFDKKAISAVDKATLGGYFDKSCVANLKPGQYYVFSTYTIELPDGVIRKETISSNIFTVN